MTKQLQRGEEERMAQIETRLLAEFLKETWPDDTIATNVELGPVPAELIERFGTAGARARIRPFRRRVDAVHWTAERYDLVEVKIRDPLPGLGGLLVYRALAADTPDMVGYEGQPIHLILVTPFTPEWVSSAARRLGVEVVEFWRPWIADYYREVQNYFTRDYRIRRDERQRLRELLGVG